MVPNGAQSILHYKNLVFWNFNDVYFFELNYEIEIYVGQIMIRRITTLTNVCFILYETYVVVCTKSAISKEAITNLQ